MFDTYRAVFRIPGTAAFCAAAFVMRIPMAMYAIGLVLIVSARTGQYGFGGLVSGVYVIAGGIGNPTLARVSDRIGQQRLLLPATAVHVASAVLLAACAALRWPDWSLLLTAAVCGFSFLSVSSLVRARWSYVLGTRPELSTAYSLESSLDEVIFVLGPLLATVLATQVWPESVLLLAAGFVTIGAIWLHRLSASAPPPRPVTQRQPSALRSPGLPPLVLVGLAMGVIFASAEITIVAFCGERGLRGISGAVVACFALGSASAGFAYGSRRWRATLLDRFRAQSLVFGVLTLAFLLAVNVPVLGVCAFVVGLGIAPTLITAFGLVERLVPAAALTEALAWFITGISLGYGVGASLVGGIADAHGARTAFLVTVGAGVVTAVLGVAIHARLRRLDGLTDAGKLPAPDPVLGRVEP